jgi:hypothetical protein
MSKRLFRIFIAFDQLINAVFNGYPDETISSRAGKASIRGERWGCILCSFLDKIDKEHCIKSIEYDEGKIIYGIRKNER